MNNFTKPDRPFLLMYEDSEEDISYSWCKTEEELLEVIKDVIRDGCIIIDAIEIGSCRDIDYKKYNSDDSVRNFG